MGVCDNGSIDSHVGFQALPIIVKKQVFLIYYENISCDAVI